MREKKKILVTRQKNSSLTHFLSHQVGAVHVLPVAGKGTLGSGRFGKGRKRIRQFDCQNHPSSLAVPDNRNRACLTFTFF